MNKINNQIRREEFDKRRTYKGKQSVCNGYECPIFQNCLVEINRLKKQLEEKDKVIDEAIKYIRNGRDGKGQFYSCCVRKVSIKEDEELLEILERGKNVNSK